MQEPTPSHPDATLSFREVLDQSPGGVLVERDARIVYINQAYASTLGYEPRELVGRNIAVIIAREDRERLMALGQRRTADSHAPTSYEFLALTKSGETVALAASIAVLRSGGHCYITTFIREHSVQDFNGHAPARLDSLSAREKQVIDRLLSGKRPKEIAFELGLSVKTVSTHQTRALQKLGVADRYELYRISSRLSA